MVYSTVMDPKLISDFLSIRLVIVNIQWSADKDINFMKVTYLTCK